MKSVFKKKSEQITIDHLFEGNRTGLCSVHKKKN